VCHDFIPYDQLVRYKWWYRDGYMSSTGKCFDIGAATKQSLEEFERRQFEFSRNNRVPLERMDSLSDPELLKQFNSNCSEEGVAGNGALMRLAPVPLFFYRHPEHAIEFSGISGRITHGDQSAYDACRYYGALIVAALRNYKKKELLANDFYSNHKRWFNNKPLHPEIMKIAEGSYKKEGGHSAGIRGKGYIVQSLEAALWAFWSDGDSFEAGVLAAVNLGDDTDTTAAIYGQLAGAYYGYRQLPKRWLESVYAKNFIQCLSKWIVYEGEQWSPERSLTSAAVPLASQGQSATIAGSSSKHKTTYNSQQSHPQKNSQQNFKASSGKSYGSGSKSQSTPQPTPNSVQDHHSKPNADSKQYNNNAAAYESHHDSNTNGGSNWESTSNEPPPSTHPNSNQLQVPISASPRKSFVFE
jgi:ADP-ribosylglycohydrolase